MYTIVSLLKQARETVRYRANGTSSTSSQEMRKFLIALDRHERSITKFFIVRNPLEHLMFAPAHCILFSVFDSNPRRYPYLYLSKHPNYFPVLSPCEFIQFPASGRNVRHSLFGNWLVFSLGQQRLKRIEAVLTATHPDAEALSLSTKEEQGLTRFSSESMFATPEEASRKGILLTLAKFALAYAGQTSDIGGMRALRHFQITPSTP